MLKEIFEALAGSFASDQNLIGDLWREIDKRYNERGRHYHNLVHLQNLYQELVEVKSQVKEWDIMLFSLFYHDIVYNTLRQTNEEKSAQLANERLTSLHVAVEKIEVCRSQILATKGHSVSDNPDTNIFTDADLSILGKDSSTYFKYAAQIRKEYFIYPSLVYNSGRKKVLNHFLSMKRIFKTEHFYLKYEEQARVNLSDELRALS
jgi:predicted metal-dependent HD superfamily phosphohydrolase